MPQLQTRPRCLAFRSAISAILVVMMMTPATRADVVASDSFTYPDGPLGNQNDGIGWAIPWYTASNPDGGWEVTSGAVYTESRPYSSYCGRWYNNPAATPQMFISVDLILPAVVDINDTIGIYLYQGANFTSLAIGKPLGAVDFELGASSWVPTGVAANPNTTYRLVGVYDISNARDALWINPDAFDYYNPATGANSADASVPYNPGHVGALYMIAYAPSGGQKSGVGFDNLIIANTPDAVGLRSSATCACGGDLTGDGRHDGSDIQPFVRCCVSGGDCGCAELDGMPGLSPGDVSAFVQKLLAGPACP